MLAAGLAALALGSAACGGDDSSDIDGGNLPDGGGPGDIDSGPGDPGPLGGGLATLSGGDTPGNKDGDRSQAQFDNPVNVVVIASGDLLVADFNNGLIRKVTPDGTTSTVLVAPDGAMFVRPFGMAVAGDSVYIQTDGNSLGRPGGALWRMRAEGGQPELVRDNVGRTRGVAAMPDGTLVLADYQAEVLWVFDPATGQLTLLAGAVNQPGMKNGQGGEARFDTPYDVVPDGDGAVLVSDFGNHCIRRVTMAGDVTTYAGKPGESGQQDGSRDSARFNGPQGLAMAGDGTLYVTDTGNFLVRAISPDGQVSTVAGDGSPGFKDADDPRSGEMYGLEGIDVSADGAYLYVADGNRGGDGPYHRVRRISFE